MHRPGSSHGSSACYWWGGSCSRVPAKHSLVATSEAAKAQGIQPLLYVIDLLPPVASLGVRNGWTPTGLAQWLVVVWTLAGRLLGLTLIAAISGALKPD